jgi:hypothetical protein
MSRKHAGPIVASSFVAGLLVTAAVFLPRVNEPIPEPFFGLDEQEAEIAIPAVAPGRGTPKPSSTRSVGSDRLGMSGANSLAAMPIRNGQATPSAAEPRASAR